jgi:hypothetical protein
MKNGNVADGIKVEVMELKPVVVKKAAKERTSGEGQSLFGKMVECDDFVDILHGERVTERGAPVDKVLLLQQPLGNQLFQIVKGALTVCPLRGRWLRILLHFLDLRLLGRHLRCAGLEILGGCGERGGEVGVGVFLGGRRRCLGSDWGFGGF